jgi:hypothetical protein
MNAAENTATLGDALSERRLPCGTQSTTREKEAPA